MKRLNNRGFTLVELLVVIAIIGILAAVVLVSLSSARIKARDSRRVADLRQIALALENYYDDNQQYPASIYGGSLANWMSVVPLDPGPLNPQYGYNTANCTPANQRYVLRATLEDENNAALDTDADGTVCTVVCTETAGGSANDHYCLAP
jgi:prepilin-type N-terminal cleavage/methylation domain-containing protein